MYQLLESHDVGSDRVSIPPRLEARQRRAWKWLGALDRALLELVSNGASHRTIAAAVGLSPGSVSRRLTSIHQRITAPLTQLLLNATCPVSDEARRAALLHQLTGLSTRRVACVMGIPHDLVIIHLSYVRGLLRGVAARSATHV